MAEKVRNWFDSIRQFTTLKQEVKILRKELEESKEKEIPYIDKIQLLKGENRTYKIQNTRLKNENEKLKYEIIELKSKLNNFFEE